MNKEADNPDNSSDPLSREDVERLFAAGLIPSKLRPEVFGEFQKGIDWTGWLRRWLGALGAIFLMAGTLFFFAHNWKEMSPVLRFSVLEIAVMVTAVSAIFVGIQNSSGKWLLSGSSVLTGILIAVYGQVYQTGADAFEVFALWSALILVWVMVAKFAPLWLFWLVVTETALLLFGGQVIVPDEIASWISIYLALGVFTIAMLIVFEWLEPKERFDWLRHEWLRVVLVTASVFWLSAIPWYWIFDFGYSFGSREEDPFLIVGILCWLAAVGTGFWFYSGGRASLSSLGICILSPAVITVCWFGDAFLEGIDSNSAVRWLLIGTIAIVIFSGTAWFIIHMGRKIQAR